MKNSGFYFVFYAAIEKNDNPETCEDFFWKPKELEYSAKTVLIRHEELSRLVSPEDINTSVNVQKNEEKVMRDISLHAFAEPGGKSRNSYLRLIDALSQALTKTDLTQVKAVQSVLHELATAGIASPVGEKALGDYLREAKKLRETD